MTRRLYRSRTKKMLGGVCGGLGGTAILFSEMFKSVREGGFKHADLVQIGVDNDKMQRESRDLGIDFYKTHRMYARNL